MKNVLKRAVISRPSQIARATNIKNTTPPTINFKGSEWVRFFRGSKENAKIEANKLREQGRKCLTRKDGDGSIIYIKEA